MRPRLLTLTAYLLALPACGPDQDTVDLAAFHGTDTATLLLTGRHSACNPYEVAHG